VKPLRPLAERPARAWAGMRGVFADIDDTLTTDGKLTADVLRGLERLRDAGLLAVPITGRPAGWCDMIARQWPVDAVVGENGALYFRYDPAARRMLRVYADPPLVRAEKRERLKAVAEDILAAVPGAALAADQAYRESDLAIDFCEDVPALPPQAIDTIVRRFEAHGATAKVSSIHVNGWFGAYDKLTMTRRLMAEAFGVDLAAERGRYVFIGDSPNDAPMFAYFPHAVGVANLRELADRCPHLPRWITERARGAGFVELVDALLVDLSG
jgi:HAD superfamily hydrolase (TIGR01484 family)